MPKGKAYSGQAKATGGQKHKATVHRRNIKQAKGQRHKRSTAAY